LLRFELHCGIYRALLPTGRRACRDALVSLEGRRAGRAAL
jgi:hypothetical protein